MAKAERAEKITTTVKLDIEAAALAADVVAGVDKAQPILLVDREQ